jgi:thiamine transporter
MRNTSVLVETAIMVALAFVLEVAFSFLPAMPQGGRVSLSMLPIIVLAWRQGVKIGSIGGAAFGLLNLMLDGVLYHWGSLFLDYLFAFGLIGVAGVYRRIQDNVIYFGIGIVTAFVLRFTSSTLSGVILFGEYAPDNQNVWIYSMVYNGTYLLPALLLTIVVGVPLYYALRAFDNETY